YDYLNEVYIDSDKNQIDLRFPVQGTLRLAERRLVLGQIASGSIKCGEEILVLPAHTKATIQNIIVIDQKGTEQALQTASIGKSVALELSTPVDTGRGSMIVRPGNIPTVSDHFQSMLIWMSSECIRENEPYILQQGTQRTRCKLTTIHYKLDVNTLQRHAPINLGLNDITLASIQTASVICADTYEHNRATGGFILISPTTNATVAAGVILNRQTDKFAALLDATQSGTITKSGNIHRESSHISQREREQHLSYQVSTLWFMGLSASGKSTLAKHLERNLFDAGKPVMRLDGDNLRHGLNADLGFSKQDRKENIRRIAHVAKLFNDAGIICLVCAISPYEADRAIAREVIGPHKFNLVHVSTSLEICEKRDPHGLYQRARRGEIEGFTGISAPFESPQHAAFTINTTELSIEDCLDQLIKHFDNNT
ncbi:MAG: adenylyl-sulfate kinase, partial [Bdellovibrionales bacterium]|nr:adenylyl-sulfate kinase [Bdellovibrionales bacterium]